MMTSILSDSRVKLNEKIHFAPSNSRVFKIGELMPNGIFTTLE